MVYVLDINQPSLPTTFTLFLWLFLSYDPFTCISFHKFSRQLSVFSLCSPSLISALLVLSTIYLFLQVSLNGFRDPARPRSGELRTQKLKSLLVRTQSLSVLPLKPGVGQYIAIHATLTAREFSSLLISTLPVHSPAFFQNLSRFFLCWLWLTHGSCVGP